MTFTAGQLQRRTGSSVVTVTTAPLSVVTIALTATDNGGTSAADYSGVPASATFAATDTSELHRRSHHTTTTCR